MKYFNLVAIMATVGFTLLMQGCASDFEYVKLNNKVQATVYKDNHLVKFKKRGAFVSVAEKFNTIYPEILKYGQSKEYKYFAIVNKGMNNLNGFPVNNLDSMNTYLSIVGQTDSMSSKIGHFQPSVLTQKSVIFGTIVKVKFYNEKIPGVFLWKI